MHTDSGPCRPSRLLPGSWVPCAGPEACSSVRQASEPPPTPGILLESFPNFYRLQCLPSGSPFLTPNKISIDRYRPLPFIAPYLVCPIGPSAYSGVDQGEYWKDVESGEAECRQCECTCFRHFLPLRPSRSPRCGCPCEPSSGGVPSVSVEGAS